MFKGATPGVDWGHAGKRAVRFGYASSEDNIREAARRLGEYLGKRQQGSIPLASFCQTFHFDQRSRAQHREWTSARRGRGR